MEVIKGVPFFLAVTHDAGLRHLEKGSSTWCADVVINWSFISGVLKKIIKMYISNSVHFLSHLCRK